MTDDQMEALEHFISKSRDASDFAKRVIIWTLRQTNNLTDRVILSVPDDYGTDLAKKVQDGVHYMQSDGGTTHLDSFFLGMKTEFRMCHHCGIFSPNSDKEDKFDPDAKGRTIWVSYVEYDREAKVLALPSLEDLMTMRMPNN